MAKFSKTKIKTIDTEDWLKELLGSTSVQVMARNIAHINRPYPVDQGRFDKVVRDAAVQIVDAYLSWGGVAPDSVYRLAGKLSPKERAISFNEIYHEVGELVQLADEAENTITILYDVYYDEDFEQFYCLGVRDGIVYKIEILVDDDYIRLGEFIQLNIEDLIPRSTSKFKVYRGLNNEPRWLSIASVAVLNRIGQIDSRELFDSFIDFAVKTNHYPVLNVYHLGEGSEIGQADLLARRGFVYIASGYFHNNKYGRAFAEALQGRDDWGNSIEFFSPNPEVENFEFEGANIQVPIYKRGINTGITLVKERDAASVLTIHKS